jgi:hypothetical protein
LLPSFYKRLSLTHKCPEPEKYLNKEMMPGVHTLIILASWEVEIELKFEASPGKKFMRPHLNQ